MTSWCMCRWASYYNVLAICLLFVLVTTKAHATLKPHKEFPSTELLRKPLTQGPMLGGVTCGLLSVPSADASTSVTRSPLTVSPEESRGYNPKHAPGRSYLTASCTNTGRVFHTSLGEGRVSQPSHREARTANWPRLRQGPGLEVYEPVWFSG